MLIERFNIFERTVLGADSFDEAVTLLETEVVLSEGMLDSIKNYFSRLLGGKIKKLDKILKRYKSNEDKYWDNWIKARNKFYEAELMSGETHGADRDKYEEMKKRAEKYEKQVETTRKDTNDSLEKQAKILMGTNKRLEDFWEYNKSVVDEQIAKNTLETAKKDLSDKTAIDEIHKRLEAVMKAAKKNGEEFDRKYGKDFDSDRFRDYSVTNKDVVPGLDIEKLRAMSPVNLTDLRKSLEGKLKRLREDYDDEINDIKRDTITRTKEDPDYEFHQREMNRRTKDAYTRFARNRDMIKKQIEIIDNMVTSMKLGVSNMEQLIKSNPTMVTPTGKEEIGKRGIDSAAQTAIQKTSQETKPTQGAVESMIDKDIRGFFQNKKGTIDRGVGVAIPQPVYDHIINDMVNLFGKLTMYYKSIQKDFYSQVLGVSLSSFAKDVYRYKKEKGELNKDLSDKELDDKVKEFEEFENK